MPHCERCKPAFEVPCQAGDQPLQESAVLRAHGRDGSVRERRTNLRSRTSSSAPRRGAGGATKLRDSGAEHRGGAGRETRRGRPSQRPLVIHPFRFRGASVTPKVDICKCRSSSAASSIRSPGDVQGEKLHRSSRSSWKRDTEGVRAAVRVCVVRVSSSARRIRRGGTPRPPRGEARCRGRRFTGQRKTGAKRR